MAIAPHQYAARRAIAQFAAGLRKFVDVGLVPDRWVGKVDEGHCFIGVRSRHIGPEENDRVQELVFNMNMPEEDLVWVGPEKAGLGYRGTTRFLASVCLAREIVPCLSSLLVVLLLIAPVPCWLRDIKFKTSC
jgi:hypothetical protein